MPVFFRIFPALNLAYTHFSGVMMLDESAENFARHIAHPDYRAGQKQLIDLSEVTDWERDFPKIMALQARTAEAFYDPKAPTLLVALAPTKVARTVADMVNRSWDDVDWVRYLTAHSVSDALHLLGLPAQAAHQIFRNA